MVTGTITTSKGEKIEKEFDNAYLALNHFSTITDNPVIAYMGSLRDILQKDSRYHDLAGIPDFEIKDETGKVIAEFKKI